MAVTVCLMLEAAAVLPVDHLQEALLPVPVRPVTTGCLTMVAGVCKMGLALLLPLPVLPLRRHLLPNLPLRLPVLHPQNLRPRHQQLNLPHPRLNPHHHPLPLHLKSIGP